jgi:DNA-binding MarR family transcriptional regulator
MATDQSNGSYEVAWLVRRLFRTLAQKSTENLAAVGITAADRVVMEFLYPDESLSVPAIADRYRVTRQHRQVTVNSLLDKGLVATQDNRRHKRSPLINLKPKGRNLFASVLEQGKRELDRLCSIAPVLDLRPTRRTLNSLLQALS